MILNKVIDFLGFKKLDPEVQDFLDKYNARTGIIISAIIILMEFFFLVFSFMPPLKGSSHAVDSLWLLKHRLFYALMVLSAAQFALVSFSMLKNKVNHFFMQFSMLLMLVVSVCFGIYISRQDYIAGEQILVFLTIMVMSSCGFFIKPYIIIILITASFLIFYNVMKISSVGVSFATKANLPIFLFLLITVHNVLYKHFINIAEKSISNEKLSKQLLYFSMHDTLTDVKNRHALREDFLKCLNKPLLLMLTDIDDFKGINDTYGHEKGDAILKDFSSRLKENFGEEFCYRYGGDEFLVMIPHADEIDFLLGIKKCREPNNEFTFSGGYIMGIAHTEDDLRALVARADKNLYEAKRNGKNRVIG